MTYVNPDTIRQAVRTRYGSIAHADITGCGCGPTVCCAPGAITPPDAPTICLGYTGVALCYG